MMSTTAPKPPSSATSAASRKKPKGRTFQCTGYPECNMTFTRSEHLARHIRKHTGERPFECNHCARKFSRLDNLRQHKQTVHAHEQQDGNNKPISPLASSFPRRGNAQPLGQLSHVPQLSQQGHDMSMGMGQHYPHPHVQIHIQPQPVQQAHNYPEQQTEIKTEVIEQNGADLQAAQTLLRPTQFRSKRRPRPLDLPIGKPMYNDAPFTVPTPRSAGSNYFVLSPVSQGFHYVNPPATALPGVHFLTGGGNGDSLVSPFNSSFGSSVYSAMNTPTASSFDNLSTPTNMTFSSPHDYRSPLSNDQVRDNITNRRSWLNNVLNNNYDSSTSTSSSISQPSPSTVKEEPSDKKVRIESLLNSGSPVQAKKELAIVSQENAVKVEQA